VRNEAGQLVLAGPRKGAADGELYKKWAKHNKRVVAAAGGFVSLGGDAGHVAAAALA
jgi:hypothetical protein